MHLAGLLAVGGSFILFAQSLFSLYLMLYTWEHPERLEVGRGPSDFPHIPRLHRAAACQRREVRSVQGRPQVGGP